MAVTSTDITNRALQLIGTRTTVASLAEASNEAIQANLVFAAIRDWCLGTTNWNFARGAQILVLLKHVNPPPNVPWDHLLYPFPPWKYEYQFPADALQIRYITNDDLDATGTFFLGEPKRFAVASDVITAVEYKVILCNESIAIANYTRQMTDPTTWPWYFERFMVSTLAATLAPTLTGREELVARLKAEAQSFMALAIQTNFEEGLIAGDTTPEWIQALGFNYPQRRDLGKSDERPQERGNDNRR